MHFAERFARRTRPAAIGALLLIAAYVSAYFRANQIVPRPGSPGWWNWFDQGVTLKSALAFAHFDFSPAAHWYLPGYALLGTPFLALGWQLHPFVLIDLLCLLGVYFAFLRVAVSCGVRETIAAAIFLCASFWSPQIFLEWVIPWNTTPTALILWLLLAFADSRRPLLLGLLAAAIPWFRPTDALFGALCIIGIFFTGALRLRDLPKLALGVCLVLLPLLGLYMAIYGPHVSPYLAFTRQLSFTAYDFGWKLFVIFSDPIPWFADGEGILHRLPWMLIALAGLLPALVSPGRSRVLASVLIVHLVLYVSYLDLLPPSLWRFNNIHYWNWAFPGYALLAYLLVRDFLSKPSSAHIWIAACSLIAVTLLSCVNITPRPASSGEPAKMLILPGPSPSFADTFFGTLTLSDSQGSQRNVFDFRAVPSPAGERVVALRRPFVGVISPLPTQPARFAERLRFGRPCWIPLLSCSATLN